MGTNQELALRHTRLRESFSSAEAAGAQFAQQFYKHLFDIDPSLTKQFESVDMATQGAMVLQVIRVALDGIEDLPGIRPTLESLGYRHVHYGVRPEQYETATEAFIRALRQVLGKRFDRSLEGVCRETLLYCGVVPLLVRARDQFSAGFDHAIQPSEWRPGF